MLSIQAAVARSGHRILPPTPPPQGRSRPISSPGIVIRIRRDGAMASASSLSLSSSSSSSSSSAAAAFYVSSARLRVPNLPPPPPFLRPLGAIVDRRGAVDVAGAGAGASGFFRWCHGGGMRRRSPFPQPYLPLLNPSLAHRRLSAGFVAGGTVASEVPSKASSSSSNGGSENGGAGEGKKSGFFGGGGGKGSGWSRLKLFAKLVKYTRIPALILGVYGLGYQQGIIDYSRDPILKQDDLLTSILAGVGCVDRDRVRTARDGDWKTKFMLSDQDAKMRRVASVGEKIVKAAKKYVDEELGKVMAERMAHLTERDKADEERLFRTLMKDEECAFWAAAKQRMAGRWVYVLVDTVVANAFVSEILPQRIFVTTAMMDAFIENDDEMAMVLGHEVSHLILGHVSDSNTIRTMLRTVEVLLLSIDPTEGALSLAVMSFIAAARHSLIAANSRENEREADELGIKIAAMACYDTRRAARVFRKMHEHMTESGAEEVAAKEASRSLLSFIDSHPPSDERHLKLLQASEEENAERYGDTHCGSVRQMFKDMLREAKRRETETYGGGGVGVKANG